MLTREDREGVEQDVEALARLEGANEEEVLRAGFEARGRQGVGVAGRVGA